jgi:hypothetical protein
MSQQELLIRLVRTLDELDIPYMLTGSLVSSIQGEPRSTHDIDVVVDLPEGAIEGLVAAFPPPEFHLDGDSVRRAVRDRFMANLIHVTEGDKVDLWLLTDTAFDRSRFERRQVVDFLGIELRVSSPEDTILQKLVWSRDSGGSEKQFHDARAVFELQRAYLDETYLVDWAARLAVSDLLERLMTTPSDRR